MTVTDELLANNATYVESFEGPLPLPPARQLAVVACMDARIKASPFIPKKDSRARLRPRRGDRQAGRGLLSWLRLFSRPPFQGGAPQSERAHDAQRHREPGEVGVLVGADLLERPHRLLGLLLRRRVAGQLWAVSWACTACRSSRSAARAIVCQRSSRGSARIRETNSGSPSRSPTSKCMRATSIGSRSSRAAVSTTPSSMYAGGQPPPGRPGPPGRPSDQRVAPGLEGLELAPDHQRRAARPSPSPRRPRTRRPAPRCPRRSGGCSAASARRARPACASPAACGSARRRRAGCRSEAIWRCSRSAPKISRATKLARVSSAVVAQVSPASRWK